jgi:uncharacterized protein YlxW (UPF0749 family)
MKQIILLIAILSPLTLMGEQEKETKIESRILVLQRELQNQKQKNNACNKKIENLRLEIKDTRRLLDSANTNIRTIKEALGKRISDTNNTIASNQKSTEEAIRTKTNRNITISIAGILLLFAVFCPIIYLLRKKQKENLSSVKGLKEAQEKLGKVQEKIQEETSKLDNQIIDALNKKIEIIQTSTTQEKEEHKTEPTLNHGFALQVADEIIRIEKNLARMGCENKWYKPLSKAIERLENNLRTEGYEITEMLNKPYHEGLRVEADFTTDETIEKGAQIITSVLKPEVLYKGELIQKANIIVSQNI